MVKPSIEMMRLGDLVPYARNARTHSAEQVEQIAAGQRAVHAVTGALFPD